MLAAPAAMQGLLLKLLLPQQQHAQGGKCRSHANAWANGQEICICALQVFHEKYSCWWEGREHLSFLCHFLTPHCHLHFKASRQILGLEWPFLALLLQHSLHDQGSHHGIFLYNLSVSLEEKTAGASSTVGKYKEMHKNCRNINWNRQTKKSHHLGGFRDNTGDFTLIFGRKISNCLGIYLFPILIFFFFEWENDSLGCPIPPEIMVANSKLARRLPGTSWHYSHKGGRCQGLFLDFQGTLKVVERKKNTIIFSCLAASTAQIKTPGMTLRATLFPQHREGKHGKVLFLIWVSWEHQTT